MTWNDRPRLIAVIVRRSYPFTERDLAAEGAPPLLPPPFYRPDSASSPSSAAFDALVPSGRDCCIKGCVLGGGVVHPSMGWNGLKRFRIFFLQHVIIYLSKP